MATSRIKTTRKCGREGQRAITAMLLLFWFAAIGLTAVTGQCQTCESGTENCYEDSQCPITHYCPEWEYWSSKYCLPVEANAAIGERCREDDQCLSGNCYRINEYKAECACTTDADCAGSSGGNYCNPDGNGRGYCTNTPSCIFDEESFPCENDPTKRVCGTPDSTGRTLANATCIADTFDPYTRPSTSSSEGSWEFFEMSFLPDATNLCDVGDEATIQAAILAELQTRASGVNEQWKFSSVTAPPSLCSGRRSLYTTSPYYTSGACRSPCYTMGLPTYSLRRRSLSAGIIANLEFLAVNKTTSIIKTSETWHDSRGPSYTCDWYGSSSERCSTDGSNFTNFGVTANEVCSACAPPIEFDPSSPYVTYMDNGSCGPRGDDAQADTSSCVNGAYVVKQEPFQGYQQVVATVNGCDYYEYFIYACSSALQFDPSSNLVSYHDRGSCGPRGDDAQADTSSCAYGAYVVDQVPMKNWEIVASIDSCEYYSYTVYACSDSPPPFDPSSQYVTYHDKGSCGPRGDDAKADTSGCINGAYVVEQVAMKNWEVITMIDGCEYYSYTVYACSNTPPPFDPSSQYVTYHDRGACGPRGDDAKADTTDCVNGANVVKQVPLKNWEIVAMIDGCEYYSYTVYNCSDTPPPFDPSSPYVTYHDHGSCGPRGDDAKADTSSCANGAIVVDQVPNQNWEIVAMIDGCGYFSYTVYNCSNTPPPFDPSSPYVAYMDNGSCGPRGDDARADTSSCVNGAYIVEQEPLQGYQVVATVNGCDYYAYTVYDCKSSAPSSVPSDRPSISDSPSSTPSDLPSMSAFPSRFPSSLPSLSSEPSSAPSDLPSVSKVPSSVPSDQPSVSTVPSAAPSDTPSISGAPSSVPSDLPSMSAFPSRFPSSLPSLSSQPSSAPSDLPSVSEVPSSVPSDRPSVSAVPSSAPSDTPSISGAPSSVPSDVPSVSAMPSSSPSILPSISDVPSSPPSALPSISRKPSVSAVPPSAPSDTPSISDAPSPMPLNASSIVYGSLEVLNSSCPLSSTELESIANAVEQALCYGYPMNNSVTSALRICGWCKVGNSTWQNLGSACAVGGNETSDADFTSSRGLRGGKSIGITNRSLQRGLPPIPVSDSDFNIIFRSLFPIIEGSSKESVDEMLHTAISQSISSGDFSTAMQLSGIPTLEGASVELYYFVNSDGVVFSSISSAPSSAPLYPSKSGKSKGSKKPKSRKRNGEKGKSAKKSKRKRGNKRA